MAQILLVFAFVFFCIGTFASRNSPPGPGNPAWYVRFNFVSAGLAVWVLSILLAAYFPHHS
jgi:hypothetical protein